jgi:hypothetical protein
VPIVITCRCGAKLKAPDAALGKTLHCPKCKTPTTITAPSVAPSGTGSGMVRPSAKIVAPDQSRLIESDEIEDALPVEEPQEVIPVSQLSEAIPVVESAAEIPLSTSDERPPLDRSGRYYLNECAACQRRLRTPVEKRGCITQCPTCRLYNRVWGKPRRGADQGIPIIVRVSAQLLQWPMLCACCLRDHDDYLKAKHYGRTSVEQTQAAVVLHALGMSGKSKLEDAIPHESWQVPYCWDCLEHVNSRDERDTHKGCATVKEAVEYRGHEGSIHTFAFHNWQHANRFIVLNHDKCVL